MQKIILIILAITLLMGLIGCDMAPQEETTKGEETTTAEETTTEPEIIFETSDFTVLDWDGNGVKLSDFAGKPIVLNFWATWCLYCVKEMPDFDKAAKEYPDVQFLMVNATDGVEETIESAKNFVTSKGFEFNVYFDTNSEAQTKFQITGYPTTYFISADGSEVYYAVGMIGYDTLLHGISLITD